MNKFVLLCMIGSVFGSEKTVLDQEEYCKNVKFNMEQFKQLCVTYHCFSHESHSIGHKTTCFVFKTGARLAWQLHQHTCKEQS